MLISPELVTIARKNHGLLTVKVFTDAGHSRSSFYRAIDAELLASVIPGVAALAGTTIGPLQRIAAGVLSFGPDVMASHRSAAYLWGAKVKGDAPVDLLSTKRHKYTTIKGYVVHRPRDGASVGGELRRQIRCTSPYRALLDLGAVCDRTVVLAALESFLVAGHVSMRKAEAQLEQAAGRWTPGVEAYAWAIEEARLGLRAPDSDLEARCARVFRRAGLEHWVFHELIIGYEVDFCFPAERVVVEVDGWTVHGADRERWDRGIDRDLDLEAAGWHVIHLTWRMITREPERAARRLRAALERQRKAG